ncbi:MAG: hypothetical protein ACTSQ1_01375 [Promethearchaeota archaeon]
MNLLEMFEEFEKPQKKIVLKNDSEKTKVFTNPEKQQQNNKSKVVKKSNCKAKQDEVLKKSKTFIPKSDAIRTAYFLLSGKSIRGSNQSAIGELKILIKELNF